jgi:SAM-dependent methyltransferase
MKPYSDQFRSRSAAERYDDELYAHGSFDEHLGALQAAWLRETVDRRFSRPPIHLDFACGTGRMIAALSEVTGETHGYDVSAEMLSLGREKGLNASFHQITEGSDPPGLPDLADRAVVVTIFRLLLNVDEAVRDSAVQFAASALGAAEGGIVILNNHGNRRSLRELSRIRRRRGGEWFNSLSDREVRILLARHGLRVVERYGVGVFPPSTYRVPGVAPLARRLNAATAGARPLAGVSVDVTYVAELAERA